MQLVLTTTAATFGLLWSNAGEAATLFRYTNSNFQNSGTLIAEFLVDERPVHPFGYTPGDGLLKASAHFTADGIDYVIENKEIMYFDYYKSDQYNFGLYDGVYEDGVAGVNDAKYGNQTFVFRSNGYLNLASDGIMVRVGAVPEISSWAMMLVGFGMVGSFARYRRRTALVAYG
jgi:hypothetical protein